MAKAAKNQRCLIVMCDGTSNEIKKERTNVLRLFQTVVKNEDSIVFYDPGVGTVGAYSNWNRWYLKFKEILGLAFGMGLDDNVLDAYRFLIHNWQKGDRIYLFGFSRGAYTVRVLAGLIYTLGILKPEQENLSRYALNTLKAASIHRDFPLLAIYQKTLERQPVEIEFLGIWDSVSSVFLWIRGMFRIRNIGYTRRNHCIRTVRHALAIDERRQFFVQYDWKPDQAFTTHLPMTDEFYDKKHPAQNAKEVWFSGVHGDVGGGYEDADSAVPKIALEWLVRESIEHGLPVDEEKLSYFLGETPDDDGNYLSKPNPRSPIHNSLTWAWWLVEIFPKRIPGKKLEWLDPSTWLNFFIPLGKRRHMFNKDDNENQRKVLVHESVKERMDNSDYNPPNLPSLAQIEWVSSEKKK